MHSEPVLAVGHRSGLSRKLSGLVPLPPAAAPTSPQNRPPTQSAQQSPGAAPFHDGGTWFPPLCEPRSFSATAQDGWSRQARSAVHTAPAQGRKGGNLEDENKSLREEIGRMQSATVDSFHRRPRAAIAGGGFRGPAGQGQRKCMCEELQARLAKTQALLIEARRTASKGSSGASRASTGAPPDLPGTSTPASVVETRDACAQASSLPAKPKLVAVETQTEAVDPPRRPQFEEAQTQAEPARSDVGQQAGVALGGTPADASSQTEPAAEPPSRCDSGCQTSAAATSAASVQTERPPFTSHVCTQTQAQPSRPTRSAESQANPSTRAVEAQTAPLQDDSARIEALLKEANANTAKLAQQVASLEEGVKVWREKATKQLLGQVNITILCPRAECNVNGHTVEMDGWNPEVLKREFEREVLPRFTRIFVEQAGEGGGSARTQAAQKASKEFAEAFRERLSSMLSAPTAESAVATKGGAG